MGALTFDKLLVIGIIVMLVVGPEKLPGLTHQLAQFIKKARNWTNDAKARVSEEMGEDFTAEDWKKLDPRQYNPRRIIRDAWYDLDNEPPARVPVPSINSAAAVTGAAVAGAVAASGSSRPAWANLEASNLAPGQAPFDTEAT